MSAALHTADIDSILKNYWGYPSFRPLQREIIQSILQGKDVLALMPTGGGKSLCYQVTAMARPGLCLVISPLIALMKDQTEALRKRGITALAVYSGISRKEVLQTFRVAAESNCKFLYVSPERLETQLFREVLPGLNINLIAVDEAHCISQWGYDFRPPYLRIGELRKALPEIPVLALTASATPEVQKDICEKLHFKNYTVYRQSFERPNLSFQVQETGSKINTILQILRQYPGSSIIYCRNRKRTREISELLRLQGISADYYHAGLERETRNRKQEAWIKNKIRVMVCTNAFGMGIDKPDVRTVIHADVPDCPESYYQEAGRAGRDGQEALAVLLYDAQDVKELQGLPEIRFPSPAEIKKVYQAVANYLQLPVGAGMNQYFDFDITEFIKNFRLNATTALYAIKALEQDGWWAFSEQIFLPATVMFTTDKETLFEFEKLHPGLEPCIKSLLRGFEGVFSHVTPVSEKMLARLMRTDEKEVSAQLQRLHQYGILEYRPVKDTPQLLFLHNRVGAEEVNPDMNAYRHHKTIFTQRIQKMLEYLLREDLCRSRFLAQYFGDMQAKDCGICDNCQKKKEGRFTDEEFYLIKKEIYLTLNNKGIPADELLRRLSRFSRQKVLKTLTYLQAEQKVRADGCGLLSLNDRFG
ncbi:MAG: RecQ family ATP-dependent DNA helicase [Chitinophagaceae bacterium]|nr:RecQ family ATP-dependent DNA helicase [Chitinophagaceae bacterium]